MRVNVYAEEMTDRIKIISKEIDGRTLAAPQGGNVDGELWSFLRAAMARGANIGVDFAQGKLTYEQHSAHLDAEAAYYGKLMRDLLYATPPQPPAGCREALEKAADTFADAAQTFTLFGKDMAAMAMKLAEKGCRDVLAAAPQVGPDKPLLMETLCVHGYEPHEKCQACSDLAAALAAAALPEKK
jgi:hypothetical protein